MNTEMRKATVKAMEIMVRNLDDEGLIDSWLMVGVADGDIDIDTPLDEIDDYYVRDKTFADLMYTFTRIMKRATKGEDLKGVFYCDGIVSEREEI